MGRYASYGIATCYAIPLKELDRAIRRRLYGKSIEDFNPEELRALYPENIYDIHKTDSYVIILMRECYTGNAIFSLLKDFSSITPYTHQLSPEIIEEIGLKLKDRSREEVMKLAESREYEGFQPMDIPEYLYWTQIPIGDQVVYSRTMVRGILIGFSYDKTETEDATEPYAFLTELLRYRLKENPLSPALLAYLSV